jgi:hypothetical protein
LLGDGERGKDGMEVAGNVISETYTPLLGRKRNQGKERKKMKKELQTN